MRARDGECLGVRLLLQLSVLFGRLFTQQRTQAGQPVRRAERRHALAGRLVSDGVVAHDACHVLDRGVQLERDRHELERLAALCDPERLKVRQALGLDERHTVRRVPDEGGNQTGHQWQSMAIHGNPGDGSVRRVPAQMLLDDPSLQRGVQRLGALQRADGVEGDLRGFVETAMLEEQAYRIRVARARRRLVHQVHLVRHHRELVLRVWLRLGRRHGA